jgi:hypothetical protein
METEPRWNLATCSYRAFAPQMGVPVATSVGKPRKWRKGPLEICNPLAPYGIHGNPKFRGASDEEWERADLKRLDVQQAKIEPALDELSTKYAGHPLVLLCYEDVHKVDACHRRWAAGWFARRYGLTVPEVSPDTPPLC